MESKNKNVCLGLGGSLQKVRFWMFLQYLHMWVIISVDERRRGVDRGTSIESSMQGEIQTAAQNSRWERLGQENRKKYVATLREK